MQKYFPLLVLLTLMACSSEPASDLKSRSLLEFGIPITIMAPDSAQIETMDLVVQKDITIKKGDDYYVQIFASDASTTDVSKMKAAQLNEVRDNPFFSKIVKEDTDGFIYETAIDSTKTNYGFRHFRIKGDKEYIFQTGLIGTFSLDDVERMYEAVQPVTPK